MRRKLQRLWLRHQALAHYRRMIRWVRTQPDDGLANSPSMLAAIGESWGSHGCVYCHEHTTGAKQQWMSRNCGACELGSANGCCGGAYRVMVGARTHREWLIAAEGVVAYIKKYGAKKRPAEGK